MDEATPTEAEVLRAKVAALEAAHAEKDEALAEVRRLAVKHQLTIEAQCLAAVQEVVRRFDCQLKQEAGGALRIVARE